jgi:uncharacterized membrane protein
MRIGRWIRHAARTPRAVDRAFPPTVLGRIEEAIRDSEVRHRGEIRLAVEAALPWSYVKRDAPVRERAEMLFAKLRMWDTDERNGVLIYVELADQGIEIVADRGLARVVPPQAWPPIVAQMAERFRAGDFEGGAKAGIDGVARLLAEHFPAREGEVNRNELPNRPYVGGR